MLDDDDDDDFGVVLKTQHKIYEIKRNEYAKTHTQEEEEQQQQEEKFGLVSFYMYIENE